MRGYGMFEINNVGWLEKDIPEIGPLDALMRPVAVAVCSSDTHMSHGGSGPAFNVILGHEAIGEVVKVGDIVDVWVISVDIARHRIALTMVEDKK